MTFGAGNRAMRSIDPRPKCGGEKPHKGRSPTGVFRSPSRYCGEAYTDLLYDVFLAPRRPPYAMDGVGRYNICFYNIIFLIYTISIYPIIISINTNDVFISYFILGNSRVSTAVRICPVRLVILLVGTINDPAVTGCRSMYLCAIRLYVLDAGKRFYKKMPPYGGKWLKG
jgi:hypothetical protein